LPALMLLELLSQRKQKLSELLAPLEDRYFISGEINSRVNDPQARMKALADHYSDGDQNTLDGISVLYPTWHFNVRPSNTEPLIRLNLESTDSFGEMEAHRDEVLSIIRAGD
jgi:phosphomannomutase